MGPYTFHASAVTGFPNVRAEMAHYLDLGVDGVIPDNPDQSAAPTQLTVQLAYALLLATASTAASVAGGTAVPFCG